MYKVISFLPESYFFFVITLLFIYCIIYSLSSNLKYPNIYRNTVYLSLLILCYTLFLYFNNSICYFDFSIIYKNQSNLLISELLILICIFILLVSTCYNKYFNIDSFEYIVFILISLGSLLVFINVLNFVLIYIILELQSILISILISIKKSNRYSIEGSIKYFILGSFSSLILLFGISVIYGSTGMLSINELNLFFEYFETINNDVVLTSIKISSVFILVGLLFKIYSAPFHFWLPDIYEGSPTSVLIYISTIQVLVMVFFFLKIYYYILFDVIQLKQFIISIISILTLLFGSLGALSQRKIKKLVSYSAVTMNGFFLFSIIHNNSFLLETSIMYLFIYIFTIIILLTLLLNLFIHNNLITNLTDLFNVYVYNKYISTIFTILVFSISGIPPFIGFISKLFWLKSLLLEYSIFTFFLILIFLIVSFYYVRLIKNIYFLFDITYSNISYLKKISYTSSISVAYIQIMLFFFIVNSSILINFIKIVLLNFFYFI